MAIEYPAYMQDMHRFWLDGTVSGSTIVDTGGLALRIKDALTTNPFTGLTPYDPTNDVTAMGTAISTFQTLVTAIDPHTLYDTYHNAAVAQIDATIAPDSYIAARALAHGNALDTELNMKVIPRFNAGMRDINGVQTSTFVIGRALIELDRNDKVDKFIIDMRYQADAKRAELIQSATAEMIRIYLQKMEYERTIEAATIEKIRLGIAAEQDYQTELKALAADLARWPLEVFKYGGNMLAAIAGGTTSSVPVDGSKTARIIGSGLAGAVAGAQIAAATAGSGSSGIGAIIGGIAGVAGAS
jgi:hypothetical protein